MAVRKLEGAVVGGYKQPVKQPYLDGRLGYANDEDLLLSDERQLLRGQEAQAIVDALAVPSGEPADFETGKTVKCTMYVLPNGTKACWRKHITAVHDNELARKSNLILITLCLTSTDQLSSMHVSSNSLSKATVLTFNSE
jgi:hypothetical protein